MLEAAAAGGGIVKSGRKSGDPAADKKLQRLEAQVGHYFSVLDCIHELHEQYHAAYIDL